MRPYRLSSIALALALIGCAQAQPDQAPPPPPPAPVAQDTLRVPLPPPPPPPGGRKLTSSAKSAATDKTALDKQTPQDVAPPSNATAPDASSLPDLAPLGLVGLGQDKVKALIGPPATVSQQASAVEWSYTGTDCGLDLWFFLNLGSQTFQALTVDVNPHPPRNLEGKECLDSLRRAAK